MENIHTKAIIPKEEKIKHFLEIYKDMTVVELVSKTWEKRKKTNLIKWLIKNSDISLDTLANYLNCSKQYLNNKLNRDSFSLEDLIITAYACDFTLSLLSNDGEKKYYIDVNDFFNDDKDTLERIQNLKYSTTLDHIRMEYEQKKAELKKIKEKYGFED